MPLDKDAILEGLKKLRSASSKRGFSQSVDIQIFTDFREHQ